MNSVRVQVAAATQGGIGIPSTLCQARDLPTRVLVRNNNVVTGGPADGTFLYLSYDQTVLAAVAGGPGGGNVYKLPLSSEDVFVLQPGQVLYAIAFNPAPGGGSVPVEASWAISDLTAYD